MGKETLFHPISLASIRGAFRQSGFRVGKLRQVFLAANKRRAWYRAEIKAWPNDLDPDTLPYKTLIGGVRSCFSYDVKITALDRTHQGVWWVDLNTTLDPIVPVDEPLFPLPAEKVE